MTWLCERWADPRFPWDSEGYDTYNLRRTVAKHGLTANARTIGFTAGPLVDYFTTCYSELLSVNMAKINPQLPNPHHGSTCGLATPTHSTSHPRSHSSPSTHRQTRSWLAETGAWCLQVSVQSSSFHFFFATANLSIPHSTLYTLKRSIPHQLI